MSTTPLANLFVVRQYDGMDRLWIDVSESVSQEEAQRIWDELTNNGTKNIEYSEIDYYAIFPADTVMLQSDAYRELMETEN